MRGQSRKSWLAALMTAGVVATAGAAFPAESNAQAGSMSAQQTLGTVQIPSGVMANGEPLAAGSYEVRLTTGELTPAPGASRDLERWVEFVQDGEAQGREVASVVPQSEISEVAAGAPPAAGAARVEMLRGNEYLRVWMREGDNHYLIHLATGQSGT